MYSLNRNIKQLLLNVAPRPKGSDTNYQPSDTFTDTFDAAYTNKLTNTGSDLEERLANPADVKLMRNDKGLFQQDNLELDKNNPAYQRGKYKQQPRREQIEQFRMQNYYGVQGEGFTQNEKFNFNTELRDEIFNPMSVRGILFERKQQPDLTDLGGIENNLALVRTSIDDYNKEFQMYNTPMYDQTSSIKSGV